MQANIFREIHNSRALMHGKDSLTVGVFIMMLFFIINPFIACICSLYNISKKRLVKQSFTIVILFAALYGYTYLSYDNDDITRHYYFFSVIREFTTLKEFILYETINLSPDFGMDFIYLVVGKFTSSHQIVGVIGATLYYGLILGIIHNWLKIIHPKNFQFAFISLVLFMLAVIPSNEFNGLRQCNANALFLYIISSRAFYKWGWVKRICVACIPLLLHFSLLPIVIIFLIGLRTTYKKSVNYAIVLGCMAIALIPIMFGLMKLLPNFGIIGVGISSKIETYMFGDEIQTELHMGSSGRFYLLILMVILFPIVIKKIHKCAYRETKEFTHIFYFTIIFYGYLILTSQTYIFSRTLMLFKILLGLSLSYLAFSSSVPNKTNQNFKLIIWLIALMGPIFFIQAMEYRVVNPAIFYASLPEILTITTDPAGYPI